MNNPDAAPPHDQPDIFTAYGSNGFRLTLRQWVVVLGVSALFVQLAPALWKRIDTIERGADYRMNYELSNDYWLYKRNAEWTSERCDTVVLGDSVVWGQYAARNETLSHYLNELSGREHVANLGLDGAHPMALAGLIDCCASSVAGKTVILICNPLWMSSPRHDLQIKDEFRFNHPKLVPQFSPWIPCYKEEVSARLGNIVERNSSFNGWTSHVQLTCFDKSDIPAWSLDHSYASPMSALTLTLPADDGKARHEPVPWTEQGIQKQDFPFVAIETSLQWRAFQRAIEILQSRGNKVCVVINPLNEHMMTDASKQACEKLRGKIEAQLSAKQIPCIAPPVLPSELYGDASHPLGLGYRQLAKQIFDKFLKTQP